MTAATTMAMVRSSKVIGIVRARTEEIGLEQARAVLRAGLPVVEISLTTPGGIESIAILADEFPDSVVGAGTVLTAATARDAIAAGAGIIVTPAYDADVVRTAVQADVAVVPGCMTPTEMIAATAQGALAVKIFPAHTWSPAALAGMLQALPDLACVPTGGIDASNAAAWIAAGAVAVGVGSALTASSDPAAAVAAVAAAVAGDGRQR